MDPSLLSLDYPDMETYIPILDKYLQTKAGLLATKMGRAIADRKDFEKLVPAFMRRLYHEYGDDAKYLQSTDTAVSETDLSVNNYSDWENYFSAECAVASLEVPNLLRITTLETITFEAGDKVLIESESVEDYNGVWEVDSVGAGTFDVLYSGAWVSTATITVTHVSAVPDGWVYTAGPDQEEVNYVYGDESGNLHIEQEVATVAIRTSSNVLPANTKFILYVTGTISGDFDLMTGDIVLLTLTASGGTAQKSGVHTLSAASKLTIQASGVAAKSASIKIYLYTITDGVNYSIPITYGTFKNISVSSK
jgi:hypothetical protein